MPDDSTQQGNDPIATDEITNYNGATVTAGTVKVVRDKIGYGDDGSYRDVSEAYPLPTKRSADAATVTSVAASTSSQQLIAANVNRRGLTLHSTTSSAQAYVRIGSTAATTALGGHSFDMLAGAYWIDDNGWTGAVQAIWTSATGGINITEYT
jgi:hypothetical protein